tara:strand:+ start:755 stop:1390 length:636 start_codon:yes stop_codon:yes gene_type:complete
MNITLQYGDENNRESESKLSFFVWNGTHEKQVGLASKDESFDVQLVKGTYMKHPATSDMTIEMGGGIVTATFAVPEGTLFKVHAKIEGVGRIPKVASCMLQARSDGALTRMTFDNINAPNSNFRTIENTGKFERLSLSEAKVYGYQAKPVFEKFFNEDLIDDTLHFDILAKGQAARPELNIVEYTDKKTGETSVRAQVVERRKIILRRKKR